MSGHEYETGGIAPYNPGYVWPNPAYLAVGPPLAYVERFARAPWFSPVGLFDVPLIDSYVMAGELPDGVPVVALRTRDWEARCCIPDRAIYRRSIGNGRRESPVKAREAFVRLVYRRLGRANGGGGLLNPALGLDTWSARTDVEGFYTPALRAIFDNMPAAWASSREPNIDALAFQQPIIPAEFRYTPRRTSEYMGEQQLDNLRWERKQRSRLGYLVPYHMLEIGNIIGSARRTRYVSIPADWINWEVPHGLAVELPWVVTYLGVHLALTPSSGLWVVFLSEWCAQVAMALLWDTYDNFRLFWLPPVVIAGIRAVNLAQVLGSPANYRELLHLLREIDQINWSEVDPSNGTKPSGVDCSPTCREDQGGAFIWYDPWSKTRVTRDRAAHLRNNRRRLPVNHPKGYSFAPNAHYIPESRVDIQEEPAEANLPVVPMTVEPRDDIPEIRPNDARVDTGFGISANPYDTVRVEDVTQGNPADPEDDDGALDLSRGMPVPPSPTPSSLLGLAVAGLKVTDVRDKSAAAVDNEGARLRFMQSLFRSAGITDVPNDLAGAVALLSSWAGKPGASGVGDSGPASAQGDNPSSSGLSARAPSTSGTPANPVVAAVATGAAPKADLSNNPGTVPVSTPSSGVTKPAGPSATPSEAGVEAAEAADYIEEE